MNGREHLTDRDLLLLADGEHSEQREAVVKAHLKDCWDCRARTAEMESAIEAFAGARRRLYEHRLRTPKLPTHSLSEHDLVRRIRAIPPR